MASKDDPPGDTASLTAAARPLPSPTPQPTHRNRQVAWIVLAVGLVIVATASLAMRSRAGGAAYTAVWFSMVGGTLATFLLFALVRVLGTNAVAAQRRAEDALRQSEERRRTIIQTAMDGFWQVDAQGRLLAVNQTYCRMSGYSEAELLALSIPDLEAGEAAGDTASHTQKIMLHGEVRFESRHRRKDGTLFDVEVSVQYRPTEGGQFVAFLRDITEQERTEKALRESEGKLRELAETIRDVFWSATPNGQQMLYISPAYEEIWGRSLESLYASPADWKTAIELVDRPVVLAALERLAQGEPYDLEYRIRRPDGSTRWIHHRGFPVRDAGGMVCRTVGAASDITERKQAEAELLAAKNLIEGILNSIPVRVFWKDKNLVFLGCNAAFARDAGSADPQDIVGKDDYQMVWRDQAESYRADDRQVIASGCPRLLIEESQTTPAGNTITLLTSKLPLLDSTGEVSGILATYMDITERKQAEDALRESEGRYRRLVEGAPDVVYTFSSERGGIYYSSHVEQVLGYSLDYLHAHPFLWNESIHPDDRDRTSEAVRECLTGKPFDIEYRIRNAHGDWRWLRDRSIGSQISDGEVLVEGLATDITERRQAEEALRASKQIIEGIINAIPMRVFWKDTNLVFLGCNASFAHDAGLADPKDIIGKDDYQMVWRDQAELYREEDRQIIATGCPRLLIEESGTTHAGKTITLLRSKLPLRDSGGEVCGLLVAYMDITERKQAEAEKSALESKLHQVQRMEPVGRLAGGVAHDFNNLLMGIMNYVELCRDELPPEHPVRGYLDEITRDAQRSADITKQLLAFARKQVIVPEVLDLNDALAGMLKMLQHLMGEDIDLAWLPGMATWPVKIDPGQLDQVLANLCVNARDAIAGVGKVAIETANVTLDDAYCAEHAEAAPGDYVVLTVTDSGCGMSKDVLAHIFEPFFTTKEVGKGTGLGLATVYGIVEQNHGHINAYSEVGKGTTFSVYLPRAASEADTRLEAAAPEELPRGTETILLAEDEKSVRVTTRLFLEALGYTVLAAETPEEARRLAGAHSGPVHLLITDVIMPGMNGPYLAAFLAGEYPKLKCLFMSGYTADVMMHRGTLNEGMPFLSKPFSRGDLARKVREVLDGDREGGSVERHRVPHTP